MSKKKKKKQPQLDNEEVIKGAKLLLTNQIDQKELLRQIARSAGINFNEEELTRISAKIAEASEEAAKNPKKMGMFGTIMSKLFPGAK